MQGHWYLQLHSGLSSRLGMINHLSGGFSWSLLRCIHEDQKVHSAQRFALKAECNSKLAVALSIMEECFQSMVDPRTGVDMIPQLLYNWGWDTWSFWLISFSPLSSMFWTWLLHFCTIFFSFHSLMLDRYIVLLFILINSVHFLLCHHDLIYFAATLII